MFKVVGEWQSKAKSYGPANKSYNTLVDFYQDRFVQCRMEFFRYVARLMQDYLVTFQTDRPMVAFVADSLEKQLRDLMKIVVRRPILEEASTAYALINLDLDKTENFLPANQINIGTALKERLASLSPKPEEKRKFLKECRSVILALLKKLQERSPLKYAVCRHASALSPNKMATDTEASVLKFKGLAESLSKSKLLSADEADNAKSQYDEFVGFEGKLHKDEFLKFDFTIDRVDEFLGKLLHKVEKYKSLWKVVMIVCVTSHGQATIERGFSVNKEVLEPNMEELSLIAQRIVYDQIIASNVKIHEYKITNDLLKSCRLAHSRYTQHLAKTKDRQKSTELAVKRKIIEDEIIVVKKKKQEVEDCIESFKQDADKLSFQAEEKSDMTLLSKANAFRSSAKEKEKTLHQLECALIKMEESKKELK